MKPDMNSLPGGWEPKINLVLEGEQHPIKRDLMIDKNSEAFELQHLLTEKECDALIKLFDSGPVKQNVSIQGRTDIPDDRTGSQRTTMWFPEMAKALWPLMEKFFSNRTMNPYTATDWWQHGKMTEWEPIGLSEMMRFMKYTEGGQHYAHYDAAYIHPNKKYRTLQSFVLYLTNSFDGRTRFIEDGQQDIPIWERNTEDWIRESTDEEVKAIVRPFKGNILVFDHRLCHDVQQYHGAKPRIIVRGDVLYKAKD